MSDDLSSPLSSALSPVEALQQELDALRAEIADALEACPCVRQQRFFDATLLQAVTEEVSRSFRYQSRAEAAEASQAALEQEIDELKQRALNGYYGREYGRVVAEKNALEQRIRALVEKWRTVTVNEEQAEAFEILRCADELAALLDEQHVDQPDYHLTRDEDGTMYSSGEAQSAPSPQGSGDDLPGNAKANSE